MATDEELETARRERDELARQKADSDRLLAERDAAYRAEVTQLAQIVQQAFPQQQPEPESDDEPLTPKRARQMIIEAQQSSIAPVAQQYYQNASQTNLRLMRQQHQDWKGYEAEILALMNQVPLAHRANLETWEQAYQTVRARHLDEIVAARLAEKEQAELERRRAEAAATDEEELDTDALTSQEPSSVAPPPTPQRGRAEAPSASQASAAGAQVVRKLKAKAPQLSPEAQRIAARFGMSAEDYLKHEDPNYSPDIFGLRDENGRMRARA